MTYNAKNVNLIVSLLIVFVSIVIECYLLILLMNINIIYQSNFFPFRKKFTSIRQLWGMKILSFMSHESKY